MKDSQQESHTEAKPKVKALNYFYNEQGDYTITLNERPFAITKSDTHAGHLCAMYNGLEAMVDSLTQQNQELYKKLQKIKALTTEIR